MPRTLGDFTPEQVEEPDEMSFGWFGVTIRTGPEFGELLFTDWAEEFSDTGETDARAGYANKVLWRRLLHPDDFEQFWQLSRQHRQSSEDLARLYVKLLQASAAWETDRPTLLPADSSPGPKSTKVSFAGTSSERATARLEADGRPDLALAVVRASELRTG